VVTDPTVMEMIRKVSPGIFTTPATFIVICIEKAADAPPWDEWTYAADCGVAAQNMMLAAFALGIGSCPALSFAKEAVREILDIPEGVEPALIVTLGHFERLPEAHRPCRPIWEGVGSMNQPKVLSEDDAFELLTFLVTSARGCVDEPETYGTFRLIDAASRLLGFLLKGEGVEDREFYSHLKEEIDEKMFLLVTNVEAYFNFLSEVTRKVAKQLEEGRKSEGLITKTTSINIVNTRWPKEAQTSLEESLWTTDMKVSLLRFWASASTSGRARFARLFCGTMALLVARSANSNCGRISWLGQRGN